MSKITLNNFSGEFPGRAPESRKGVGADLAIDIDLSVGTLRPVHEDTLVSPLTGDTLFIEDCCIQAYPGCKSIERVPVPCVKYFRNTIGYLEESSEPCGVWCRSGFPCPTKPPAVLVGSTQTYEKVIARQYMYTYVKTDGSESTASPASKAVLADWDLKAVVSGFEQPHASYCITGIKIYSTAPSVAAGETPEADNTAFFHVATISLGTVVYTHPPVSTSYGDAWLVMDHGGPPPADIVDIQYWGGSQLAGLADDTIHFTYPRQFHKWPPENILKPFAKPLRFLAANDYGYVLNCEHPEVIDLSNDCKNGMCHTIRRLDHALPLLGIRSPATYQSSVVYASNQGLVMLSGTQASLLTGEVFSQDQWLNIHPNTMVGVVHDGHYYGFTDVETIKVRLPDKVYPQNNAVLTRLSVRAKAAYEDNHGVLYYAAADGSGIYSMGTGAGYKEYTYQTIRLRNLGHMHYSHVQVDAAIGAPVDIIINNVCRTGATEVSVIKCNRARLPRWLKLDEVQVKILGKTEVYELSFTQPFTHQYE